MALAIPSGFKMGALHCGIKRNPNKEDLSLIVCDRPTVAAGVYTTNLVVAAPVVWDRERTPSAKIRAVITNSGNANACTGPQGDEDNANMAALVARQIDASADDVLVMSTGIIGHHLPMEKISTGIEQITPQLGNSEEHFHAAARGILTTDNGEKSTARQVTLAGKKVSIVGMAKGAGMIGPKMATMLGVVLTDAQLSAEQAQQILTEVANETFNCISVEGHRSTNDTLLLLASGAADTGPLSEADLVIFQAELRAMCEELAKKIPADGEGATHLIVIDVLGCATRDNAFQIAKTISDSPLVKTAITGGDPNWGRICSAAGYAGVDFDPSKMRLTINGHLLYENGTPVKFDEKSASQAIKNAFETHVELRFGEGQERARFWTSDLTVDYVRFNSEYRT